MRNTSKKAAKKRTPKHPQKTRPETGIVYTDRFAYAYGEADVQPSSLPGHSSTEMFPCQVFFLEYSASGLGIVDSGQFICRGKLAFELTIDNEQLTIKESLRDISK